jgi:hypothetical protein
MVQLNLHSLKGYLEINKKLSIKNKTTTTIKNPKDSSTISYLLHKSEQSICIKRSQLTGTIKNN